jgi:hypothetical protein
MYLTNYISNTSIYVSNNIGGWIDYGTLLLHALLSCSSLIFHVLERRISNKPMIIWEEYRLHAIVFSLKAVCGSLFGMNQHHLIKYCGVQVTTVLLVVLMFGMLCVVDEITVRHGDAGVTTVRNNDKKLKANAIVKFVQKGFSFYQFCGAGSMIVLDTHLCDLGFNTLIAIQSSAFLMTLYRCISIYI